MNDRDLLKQALEALENRDGTLFRDEIEAITALRERLAQQEQEPVAWGIELAREMVKGDKSVNWLARAIEAKLKEKNG